jgi:hypothetical protein
LFVFTALPRPSSTPHRTREAYGAGTGPIAAKNIRQPGGRPYLLAGFVWVGFLQRGCVRAQVTRTWSSSINIVFAKHGTEATLCWVIDISGNPWLVVAERCQLIICGLLSDPILPQSDRRSSRTQSTRLENRNPKLRSAPSQLTTAHTLGWAGLYQLEFKRASWANDLTQFYCEVDQQTNPEQGMVRVYPVTRSP